MGNNLEYYASHTYMYFEWTIWEVMLYAAFIFVCCMCITSRFTVKKTAVIFLTGTGLSAVLTTAVFLYSHNIALTLGLLSLTAYLPAILILHIVSGNGFFKTVPVWNMGLLVMYLGRLSLKMLMQIITPTVHKYNSFAIASLILLAILSAACFIIVKYIRKPFHYFTRLSTTSWFIPLPLILLITALFSYFSNSPSSPVLTVLLFLTVIAIFAVIAKMFWSEYIRQQLKEEQEEYETRFRAQQNEFTEITYKYDMLREYRHDMHHHLLALNNILRDSDNAYAEEYIETLIGRLEDTEKIVYCKNQMINAVLSSYIDKAKKNGCVLDTRISIPDEFNIKDIDLCIILSNALENAIHACENEDENHRYIQIEMNFRKSFCLSIINSCTKTVVFNKNGLPAAASEPEHGIGMKSIANTADKYNGILKCEWTGNEFKLNLVMFNTAKEAQKSYPIHKHKGASAVFFSIFCILLFLNLSPVAAEALEDIPIIGPMVQVITVRHYQAGWGADIFSVEDPRILLKKPYTLALEILPEKTDTEILPATPATPQDSPAQSDISKSPVAPAAPAVEESAESPAAPAPAAPVTEKTPFSSYSLVIPSITTEGSQNGIVLPDTDSDLEKGVEDMNKKIDEYIEILRKKYDWYVSHKYMGYVALEVTYSILRNDENLLSIRFDGTLNVGGSQNICRCFSLDKRTGNVIELADLFQKDADYITPVSSCILEEMIRRKANSEGFYFIPGQGFPRDDECFHSIAEDQNFYINEQNQLVIVFDEYEVAPGYMGIVEFVIPTDVIAPVLNEPSLLR